MLLFGKNIVEKKIEFKQYKKIADNEYSYYFQKIKPNKITIIKKLKSFTIHIIKSSKRNIILVNNKRYSLQVEMNDLFYNDNLNIVCINCDSVIDNNLIHHNIYHLEYNRNTTNERKIMSDLSKLGKIDMIIFNTIKIFKNVIDKYQPKYIALINKKNNYLDGYEFYNNIYIKIDKKE